MIKRLLWPVLIGALIAAILLTFFPSLKNNNQSSFLDTFLHREPLSYAHAVASAAPAVVNIYSRTPHSSSDTQKTDQPSIIPLGSGVIIDKKGYLITNYHVIKDVTQIIVALQDGRIFEAHLLGYDKLVDIAALKIDASDLPQIVINLNRKPKIGDVVLAIGNPYNIGQTTTQGIISGTGRDGISEYRRQHFIQTDASINPGNSGGALVNSLGELVGISTLTLSKYQDNEVSEGISFAIPTALAIKVVNQLIQYGKIVRGYVGIDGIEYAPISKKTGKPEVVGVLVTKISGPAKEAGIKVDDIIIRVDNVPVKSIVSTMNQITELGPDSVIPITLLRDGEKIELIITIGTLPI